MTDDEFKRQFFSCRNLFEKIQLCIKEDRYSIWARVNNPNLSDKEYLDPIVSLPSSYPCENKARKTGAAGSSYVVSFNFSVKIMGADLKIYFKGYFTEDWVCKLEIQSLRENEE